MTVPITVLVPVGPLPRHSEHLWLALESVARQTAQPDEILVIDNGAGLREPLELPAGARDWPGVTLWRAPWALGLASGFNCGIALARNELVFMLGSDDCLYPRCLELCWQAWEHEGGALGWYFVGVRDSAGYEQNTPCMAALVSKALWAVSGGFDLGSDYGRNDYGITVAACEIVFITKLILAGGRLGATYRVSDEVLYFWRRRALGVP